jgi:hypothetical protein
MVRQLYRIYLYVVTIALLILAAVGLAQLLNTLLAYTPLRGSYRVEPGQQELVQSLVFAFTAWIIAAALGALHLRLIRRDIAEYAEAASGGIRAFFLNGAEALAMLVAVITGANAFSSLAYATPQTAADIAGLLAFMIAALLTFVALEVERRRFPAQSRVGIVFQRLHLFAVPLILLVTIMSAWSTAMRTSVAGLLLRANLYNPLDPNVCTNTAFEPTLGPCSLPNAAYLWLAAAIPAAAITLYAVIARADRKSLIRMTTHIGSIALGIGASLVGLTLGLELLLRALFGIPVLWSDIAHPWNAPYDFVSPLSIGALLVGVYVLWLRAEKAYLPPGARVTQLVTEAVAAVIVAVAFWWGVGRVFYTTLEWVGASAGETFASQWSGALALTVAGLAYIPLAVHLRRSTSTVETSTVETSAPRRGFILALLAGGTITGAVGLTITLYALGTSLLGAPLTNWEQLVRAGLAALLVGVILVVSYGWTALQEHSIGALIEHLKVAAKPAKTPTATSAAAGKSMPATGDVSRHDADITAAIERVLQAYASHTVGLDEATSQIKALARENAHPVPQESHA